MEGTQLCWGGGRLRSDGPIDAGRSMLGLEPGSGGSKQPASITYSSISRRTLQIATADSGADRNNPTRMCIVPLILCSMGCDFA